MATKTKKTGLPTRAPEVDPIELELRQLQLEEMREQASLRLMTRQQRDARAKDTELTFKKDRETRKAIQAACNHRKGGKDRKGITGHGQDSNFAIVIHTYANMETSVMCQRCQMDWRPGDTAEKLHTGEKNHTGISYEEALNWPTDNEPSGACFFFIPKHTGNVQAEIARLQKQIEQLQASAAQGQVQQLSQ